MIMIKHEGGENVKKEIMILLSILVLIFSIGAVSATTATYNGMNTQKSIGSAGLQVYTMNGFKIDGICVDAFHHMNARTHPVTKGTSKIKNNNLIKLLLVQNFLKVHTPQQGKNLQYAVWYFSDGIKPINSAVQNMINKAKHTHITIPDCFNQLISTTTQTSTVTSEPCITLFSTTTSTPVVTLIGNSTTTPCITPQNSTCGSSYVLKYLGNCSSSVYKCGYKITTTYMHYDNITTYFKSTTYFNDSVSTLTWKNQSTTTNVFANTTKTTTTKVTTKGYKVWCFNSITGKKTQKIVLFNVKPKTVKSTITKTVPNTTYFSKQIPNCNTYTTQQKNHSTFIKTCITKVTHKCVTIPIITKKKIGTCGGC